jgi:hypothetical protein
LAAEEERRGSVAVKDRQSKGSEQNQKSGSKSNARQRTGEKKKPETQDLLDNLLSGVDLSSVKELRKKKTPTPPESPVSRESPHIMLMTG